MKPYIIVISGWRHNVHDPEFLTPIFKAWILGKGSTWPLFRVGCNKGGTDAAAMQWFQRHHAGYHRYVADWDAAPKGAGPIRNRAMLKGDNPSDNTRGQLADELWCWPEPGKRKPHSGTWDCFDAAVELNIHTVVMKRG